MPHVQDIECRPDVSRPSLAGDNNKRRVNVMAHKEDSLALQEVYLSKAISKPLS